MTSLYVFICGKYNERKDFENDIKDKNNSLNKEYLFKMKQKSKNGPGMRFKDDNMQTFDENKLKFFKRKRLFETKLRSVIKEIIIFVLFLFLLFVVAFSNTSSSSYQYNKIFQSTFVRRVKQNETGLKDVSFLKSPF
jgi:hypothetical protein